MKNKSNTYWKFVWFSLWMFFRFIVDWRVSRSLRIDMMLDTLKQALWARLDTKGLIYHNIQGESVFVALLLGAPWRNIDEIVFATLEWGDWFNHRQLREFDRCRLTQPKKFPEKPG